MAGQIADDLNMSQAVLVNHYIKPADPLHGAVGLVRGELTRPHPTNP